MKRVTRIAVIMLAVAPLASFAQTQGLTRSQVREELVRAEREGYRPSEHDAQYPGSFLEIKEGIFTGASVYRNWTQPDLAPHADAYLK
jgi:hypothetical protein